MFLDKVSLEDIRLFYLNFIIVILFILGFYKLSIIIVFSKWGYLLTKFDIIQYIDECIDHIERDDLYYKDHDVDSLFIYNYLNEELYLIYNCRFYFYYYGGNKILSIDDYYILNNIYSNIYNDIYILEDLKKDNVDEINDDNNNYINDYKIKYFLLNIFVNYNKEKHNLINNMNFKYLFKNKKFNILYKNYK